MKTIFLISLLLSSQIFAADKVIRIDSNNEDYSLSRVPHEFMATFVDQGFKQTEISKGIWQLKIERLKCDSNTRDVLFPDYSNAGLPMVKCYVFSKPEMGKVGTPVEESRFIDALLTRIENKIPEAAIHDCAMGGKCISFVKEINCTIDLNQEEMHNAYVCNFVIDAPTQF